MFVMFNQLPLTEVLNKLSKLSISPTDLVEFNSNAKETRITLRGESYQISLQCPAQKASPNILTKVRNNYANFKKGFCIIPFKNVHKFLKGLKQLSDEEYDIALTRDATTTYMYAIHTFKRAKKLSEVRLADIKLTFKHVEKPVPSKLDKKILDVFKFNPKPFFEPSYNPFIKEGLNFILKALPSLKEVERSRYRHITFYTVPESEDLLVAGTDGRRMHLHNAVISRSLRKLLGDNFCFTLSAEAAIKLNKLIPLLDSRSKLYFHDTDTSSPYLFIKDDYFTYIALTDEPKRPLVESLKILVSNCTEPSYSQKRPGRPSINVYKVNTKLLKERLAMLKLICGSDLKDLVIELQIFSTNQPMHLKSFEKGKKKDLKMNTAYQGQLLVSLNARQLQEDTETAKLFTKFKLPIILSSKGKQETPKFTKKVSPKYLYDIVNELTSEFINLRLCLPPDELGPPQDNDPILISDDLQPRSKMLAILACKV